MSGGRRWPTTSPATGRTVRRTGRADPGRAHPAAASRGLVGFHKIAKRRFDDISSVAVGFGLDRSTTTAGTSSPRARIGLGGVAATPLRARATEDALVGRPWDTATAAAAAEVLAAEGTPLDDHRASAAYRPAMLRQSLLRFADETAVEATR